jgi:putative addiction module CopG family antidote
MTITLPEELEQFIAEQIERGAFSSPMDVVRSGLDLLREQQLIDGFPPEELRREILVGVTEADRGELAAFDPVGSLAELRRRKAEG